MTVRIDGADQLSYIAKLYAKNREVRKDKATSEPGDRNDLSDTSERAQISDQARLLSLARDAFDRLPEVRDDKVAHFRERINRGEYRVDARATARKLLRHLERGEEAIRD